MYRATKWFLQFCDFNNLHVALTVSFRICCRFFETVISDVSLFNDVSCFIFVKFIWCINFFNTEIAETVCCLLRKKIEDLKSSFSFDCLASAQ